MVIFLYFCCATARSSLKLLWYLLVYASRANFIFFISVLTRFLHFLRKKKKLAYCVGNNSNRVLKKKLYRCFFQSGQEIK